MLTRRRLLGLVLVASVGILAGCGTDGNSVDTAAKSPAAAGTVAPTAEPVPTEQATSQPAASDSRPNRPIESASLRPVDAATACESISDEELARAEPFAITLPFDAAACRSAQRLPDQREVLLGAGGEFVPVHTARLPEGARLWAPLAGNIEFRTMQSDLPTGYHLYGAGSLRITIRPVSSDGKSIPYNPAIYLYVPDDSEISGEFADRPGASAQVQVGRRQPIVSALSANSLDPEGADLNLALFYEADGQFTDLLAEGSEHFWVGGQPRV